MTTLSYIVQDRFVEQVRALAKLIGEDDWRPDFILGIGRGGLVPAVFLSHATTIPLLSVDHSTQVAPFGDELLAQIARQTASGTRILIVDDINDSGKTIAYLRQAIGNDGALENLRVAVLIDNIRSIQTVDYRAETIDRNEDQSWFVFPWEAMAPGEYTLVAAAEAHNG
ncbi:MAG: phosphoribosyltransferase family protein [Sphingomonadales bacterium]